jgi:hypothetical protein
MKKILFVLLAIISVTLASCTENSRAKKWGGTAEVALPKGQKLVTATWKGESLWYLTRPMHEDEVAETYRFHEESSYGMWEGTYVVVETK